MANGTTPPPVPPELVELWNVIVSGVTQVSYGDRTLKYASIADLLKAFNFASQNPVPGTGGSGPVRRFACFSKGLDTGYGYGAPEHAEVADALFSRQVPSDPTRTTDVDWERGR
jgi:hypothetical protein